MYRNRDKREIYHDWYEPEISNGWPYEIGPYDIGNGVDEYGTHGRKRVDVQKKNKGASNSSKSVKSVLSKFADRTSLQGVPLIYKAHRWYSKVFWTIIFTIATAAFTGHAYYIISTFLAFETSTSVSIIYAHADFPSITLCNINPIRNSMVPLMGSNDLQYLVEAVAPTTVNKYANLYGGSSSNQEPENDPDTDSSGNGQIVDSSGNGQIIDDTNTSGFKRRKLLQADNTEYDYNAYGYEYQYNYGESDFSAYDNPINWTEIAATASDFSNVLTDSTVASHVKINAVLKEYTSAIPESNRTHGGHNFTVMLLSCSYGGVACGVKNFSRRLDIEYGNCWTFNSANLLNSSLVSRISGSKYGLDLMLFVDDAEYLSGFQLGRGIRMHIHPFKSMPFVADYGVSFKPGQEAFVALRLVNQTRKGGRYGACNDGGEYQKYYNNTYRYTLLGCINTCLERSISKTCKCYRKTQKQYYSGKDIKNLRQCVTADQPCIAKLNTNLLSRKLDCGCKQACHSQVYETNESYDNWPDAGLWNALTGAVCKNDLIYCQQYFNQFTSTDFENVLRRNFLHLKIYFKELNVQNIDETAAYPAAQFASDLGGCIGLWIGATFITMMELFEFMYQLFTVRCKQKPKEKYTNSSSTSYYSGSKSNGMVLRDAYHVYR